MKSNKSLRELIDSGAAVSVDPVHKRKLTQTVAVGDEYVWHKEGNRYTPEASIISLAMPARRVPRWYCNGHCIPGKACERGDSCAFWHDAGEAEKPQLSFMKWGEALVIHLRNHRQSTERQNRPINDGTDRSLQPGRGHVWECMMFCVVMIIVRSDSRAER